MELEAYEAAEVGDEAVQIDRGDLALLVDRARAVLERGGRRILGITGAPGAGKSYLAEKIVAALQPDAVLVPMDGFHLANEELIRLDRLERKGAPDTFDAAGYVELLRRLRVPSDALVYAPRFRRDLEESIAGAISVSREVPLVVTEGNYLLGEVGGWAPVYGLLDESWYLLPDEETRMERLIARHMSFGRSPEEAGTRARVTDGENARFIAASRRRADVLVVGG